MPKCNYSKLTLKKIYEKALYYRAVVPLERLSNEEFEYYIKKYKLSTESNKTENKEIPLGLAIGSASTSSNIREAEISTTQVSEKFSCANNLKSNVIEEHKISKIVAKSYNQELNFGIIGMKNVNQTIQSISTNCNLEKIRINNAQETETKCLIGKIKVRDFQTLIDPSSFIKYQQMFTANILSTPIHQYTNEVICVLDETSRVPLTQKTLWLYNVYFADKPIQNAIAVVVNILFLIIVIDNYDKLATLNLNKIKKNLYDSKILNNQKALLKSKLQIFFKIIVSKIIQSEFEYTLQLLMVCLINMSKILLNSYFDEHHSYLTVVTLLIQNLDQSELCNSNIITQIGSQNFQITHFKIIDFLNCRKKKELKLIELMPLLFKIPVGLKTFQIVQDTLSKHFNLDLDTALNTFEKQCNDSTMSKEYTLFAEITYNGDMNPVNYLLRLPDGKYVFKPLYCMVRRQKLLLNYQVVSYTKNTKCFVRNCNKLPRLKCSGCLIAVYCSSVCQMANWIDDHFKICSTSLS